MYMGTFGERLRRLRIEQNINQESLSRQLNISKSSVSMYERGERQPSFALVCDFARFFNVSTDYLLGMEMPAPSKENGDHQRRVKL